MALPSAAWGKSWSLTSSASWHHVRPPFLKLPINCFFLVSTLLTGSPAARKACFCCSIYSNCRLRSGCAAPAKRLTFAFREYFICTSSRPTVVWLTGWCVSASVVLNRRRLLRCHFCALIGSPAVSPSSSPSSAVWSAGSFFPPWGVRPLPGVPDQRAGSSVPHPAHGVPDGWFPHPYP